MVLRRASVDLLVSFGQPPRAHHVPVDNNLMALWKVLLGLLLRWDLWGSNVTGVN
jgi:hypothetical protein